MFLSQEVISMKRASIYLAIAWILFFANELSGSSLCEGYNKQS